MALEHRRIWSQFLMLVKPVFRSDRRGRVFAFLGGLLCLLMLLSGLNVLGSFVGRDFFTALAERHSAEFFFYALKWAGVFGLLTVVAVTYRYAEERLGLFWREWLTDHLMGRYLHDRAFYHVAAKADIDNPDQRMTEDVKTFVAFTIALSLVFLNSTIAIISFSGVLWSITPWLLAGAVGYAALGSVMTYLIGRRLVALNNEQFKREANLRYELVLVREHAQPVALERKEETVAGRLRGRLRDVVENLKRIIGVSRNLGFFTQGYTYLIQIIPVLIVAPLYLRGEVEFGVVTQAGIAFGHVLGAVSVIINEFQRLSTFAAVIGRLGVLYEATGEPEPEATRPAEATSPEDKVVFDRLTLHAPDGKRTLVKDLTLEVPPRGRLLVLGANACGKSTLLRAVAGLRTTGTGKVVHPPPEHLMILTGMPFLTEGALREQLVGAGRRVSDADLLAALGRCGLEHLADRPGVLDAQEDWPVVLSPSEQQRLAFTRLLLADRAFALLDEATSALDVGAAQALYAVLSDTSAGYVTAAHMPGLEEYHDTVLEIGRNGVWRVYPAGTKSEEPVGAAT